MGRSSPILLLLLVLIIGNWLLLANAIILRLTKAASCWLHLTPCGTIKVVSGCSGSASFQSSLFQWGHMRVKVVGVGGGRRRIESNCVRVAIAVVGV